jgi:hypothetical protein
MTTTRETRQQPASAADESRHVGHVAAEEAGNVAGEGLHQARHLAGEAKGQLTEQSRVQRDRLVETMRTFSGDLDSMANGESPSSGLATDLVRQAADRTRQLCERLEGREPAQILDDVRDFARRRPGTFLLGSLAAGVVAGRLLRGAKDGSGTDRSSGTHTDTATEYATTTTPGTPAYDATLSGGVAGEAPVTPASTAPVTGSATGTASGEAGEWTAPTPVTGPLEVDEPGQGTYHDSGTGSR